MQPTDAVLEGMIALRIHLDQATEANGALKVYPGSQRFGRLPPNRIRELAKPRPLLVRQRGQHSGHASIASTLVQRRRGAYSSARHSSRVCRSEIATGFGVE